MSYQVIARKYRPSRFADITGQEHVTRTIQNSLRMGRVGHGYIFSGLRGVGKTTAARIFAKALNCLRLTEDQAYLREMTEPCGECESCRDFEQGTSLNIAEFDAASNNSVDDIRLLREQIRYAPQKGRYRVYIIDEVHMLSIAAFNAFLKTLEEPPPHAVFIFATTELHKIPATISSRCQRFVFKRIPVAAIGGQLQSICDAEGIRVEADALQLIGRKAQGSMRDAQSILDQVIAFSAESDDGAVTYRGVADLLSHIDDDLLFAVTDALLAGDRVGMLEIAQVVFRNGFDEQDFLEKLIEHLRNLLVVRNLSSTRLIERPDTVRERYQQDAERFSATAVMTMADFLLLTQKELKFQFEYQFRFELALLKLFDFVGGEGVGDAVVLSGSEGVKKKACKSALKGEVKPVAAVVQAGPATGAVASAAVPSGAVASAVSGQGAKGAVAKPPVAASPERGKPEGRNQDEVVVSGVLGQIDVAAWQKKLSLFVAPQPTRPAASGGTEDGAHDRIVLPGSGVVVTLDALRLEWLQFLDHVGRKVHAVLATHLQSCELVSCSGSGLVEVACCRKFSYGELMAERALLEREFAAFYAMPLQLRLVYDADKDACTKAKSPFALFEELVRENEVIRYLVRTFGAELVY